MKRYFLTITIVGILLLTMNFRCIKYVEPKPFDQTFQIPVDIVSLKKSYSLTDTIWLETDITGKMIFDTKSNQFMLVDTGQINFGATFNLFGTQVTNPQKGFCDIITIRGVNTDRQLGHWSTSGYLQQYGCSQASYKCRIGFKPLIKGTYWLILSSDRLFENCSNKVVPLYATISYKYKSQDLGQEIFDKLSKNEKGGKDGIEFYTNKIKNKEIFVFKVQ
jgi:hypothetical protein